MTTRPRLIALTGHAGSGKDTVAKILINGVGQWGALAFAAPMKAFCKAVFDFSDAQLYGPSEARNAPDARYMRPNGQPLTPRFALQTLGTEWGRSCDPDLWVKLGMRQAIRALLMGTNVVITDCRFINEAKAVREAGGEVWYVKRGETGSTHISETEMDSPEMQKLISRHVDNSGALEQLPFTVAKLLGTAVNSR